MMATEQLFQVFRVPAAAPLAERVTPRFGTSWQFDFETGEFVVDGGGHVVEADGVTAWAQWCVKAMLCERFAYAIYGPNYGAEIERVHRSPNGEVARAEAERAITEALLADPDRRTLSVGAFVFEQGNDGLEVECEIVPAVGDARTVVAVLA